MRLACLLHVALMLSQCEISAFGSDPIVLGQDTSGSQGGHACAEPDDARAAREGAPDACSTHCTIDIANATSNCDEVGFDAAHPGRASIDMSSDDGVLLTVEICDPQGFVMELSDSATGDASSTSHDASVSLDGTTLHLRGSTGSDLAPSSVSSFVAETGCSTRTIAVADQIAYLVESGAGLCGTDMLRIDPPTDEHGAPNSLWYLAMAGSVDTQHTGSGLRSVELCFY